MGMTATGPMSAGKSGDIFRATKKRKRQRQHGNVAHTGCNPDDQTNCFCPRFEQIGPLG